MAERKLRQKRIARWVESTVSQSGRGFNIPSPVDLSDCESELDMAPRAMGKRKATATKSSSQKVHEPGTGGLIQMSDSDSEDDEEATQESLLHEDGVLDEKSHSESEDDFEEGGDGKFPGNVSKKSKNFFPKSLRSTVSTNSRKRGDWELVYQCCCTRGKTKPAIFQTKQR